MPRDGTGTQLPGLNLSGSDVDGEDGTVSEMDCTDLPGRHVAAAHRAFSNVAGTHGTGSEMNPGQLAGRDGTRNHRRVPDDPGLNLTGSQQVHAADEMPDQSAGKVP